MGKSRHAPQGIALLVLVLLCARAVVACGARTGLFVEIPKDAAVDAEPDGPEGDAARDAVVDVPRDVRIDHPLDVVSEDVVSEDVFDAGSEPDVLEEPDTGIDTGVPPGCEDGGATEIYIVTEENELFSLYPPTLTFTDIGMLNCNDPQGGTPFSMGVNRIGIAYVVFDTASLHEVSMANAACAPLPYTPGQRGFTTFGMGYAGNPLDGGDTLYIASGPGADAGNLGSIDTTSFVVSVVGTFAPMPITGGELTGTADGRLYVFYSTNGGADSAITQVDPNTAAEILTYPLPGVEQGNAWAFALWGGDFYMFTAPSGAPSSQITRFRPSDGTLAVIAHMPPGFLITGAGVSTCAPQG